jgi:aspartate ammonia-lyase
MADTLPEIVPESEYLEIEWWRNLPTKGSEEPMKKPRDHVEFPSVVNSDDEIPGVVRVDVIPSVGDSDDEISPMEKPINEAQKDIDNLIHIRHTQRLWTAFADWGSSEKAYRKRVLRKKKVLRNTRNEVITLTGFFLAHGRSGIEFLTVHKC